MAEKKEKKLKPKTVEIVRSFSYKMGRPNYSSADFMCSVRQQCEFGESALVSGQLDKFAFEEVKLSIAKFLEAEALKHRKPEWMTAEEVRRVGIDNIDTEGGAVDPVPEIEQQKYN